jgi:2-isopropylmalate synthase
MAHEDYVRIFDTTLRDGEQSPGAYADLGEKLEIAHALARLGVDVMEAGLPGGLARRPGGGAAHRRRGGQPQPPARARAAHHLRAGAGDARRHRQGLGGGAPCGAPAHPHLPRHLADPHEVQAAPGPEAVVEQVREMVAYARSYCDDVEFSPEDAGRSHPEFLYLVLGEAIKAGATTLNIPDTVGYTMPDEFKALIAGIMANTPGIENVVLSVHCHNDLGLATANTLAGIQAGARQVEVTINGIGERAGNTSLEEVVMACTRAGPSSAWRPASTPRRSCAHSRMVSHYTGLARSSPTRPSSAPTPSPTRPASTRTACSSTRQPTRSCARRRSAGSSRRWCWASTPGATRCACGSPSWATRLTRPSWIASLPASRRLPTRRRRSATPTCRR